MRRVVRAAVVGTIFLVAVLSGSPAGARQDETGSNTITDPCGDSAPDGHADIKSVSMVAGGPGTGGSAGTIDWTIVACAPFTTAKAPCVHVRSVNPTGAQWAVCRGDPNKVAPPCIISISLSRPYPAGGGCDGPAEVTRPNKATIVYKVPRKTFVGAKILKPQPKAIQWQALVQDYPGCKTPCDQTAYGRLGL